MVRPALTARVAKTMENEARLFVLSTCLPDQGLLTTLAPPTSLACREQKGHHFALHLTFLLPAGVPLLAANKAANRRKIGEKSLVLSASFDGKAQYYQLFMVEARTAKPLRVSSILTRASNPLSGLLRCLPGIKIGCRNGGAPASRPFSL